MARRKGDAASKLFLCGIGIYFWRTGQEEFFLWSRFAFQILPTIIFIAALFALLYYLGDANCHARRPG